MGLMFALGSVARIVGPFWAVHGYEMGPPIVFGLTALLFALSLGATLVMWSALSPSTAEQASELASSLSSLLVQLTPHAVTTPARASFFRSRSRTARAPS